MFQPCEASAPSKNNDFAETEHSGVAIQRDHDNFYATSGATTTKPALEMLHISREGAP
jgi:hypothetical protein